MAFVLAMQRGWNPQTDISFEIKGSFENLRNGVNDNSTAAFMWETFTTKVRTYVLSNLVFLGA
jgi:hypothetical protein